MVNSTKTVFNHTGVEISQENLKKMLDACKRFPPDVSGSEKQFEKQRMISTSEASSIGSMPSSTLKQGVKTSITKFVGPHSELFLDKLGERLAYERAGVRFYEAAIAKALASKEHGKLAPSLLHIKNNKAKHMELIKESIKKLGGDPTVMTPCADLVGVIGQGFMQVLTDPRTEMTQILNTLLNIELIDNAAWDLLIKLANNLGHSELVKQFQEAISQEEEHLNLIKKLSYNFFNLDKHSNTN